VCAYPREAYTEGLCDDRGGWQDFLTVSMVVTKGLANIKYRFPERTVDETSIGRQTAFGPLPVTTYTALFDKLFPKYTDTFPRDDAPETHLLLDVTSFVEDESRQIELLYLPLLLQETDLSLVANLPLVNQIYVVSTKRRFYVSWAWQSLYVFYACIAVNWFWCICRGIQIFIIKWPRPNIDRSNLSEIDFVDALLAQRNPSITRLAKAYKSLGSLETKEIVEATKHLRVHVAIAIVDGSQGELGASEVHALFDSQRWARAK